jgi:hypothetical protein
MWQELSADDKVKFGACVFAMAVAAFLVVFLAVNGYWIHAAVFTFAAVQFAFLLYYKVIKPASGERQPPTINPDTPV